MSVLTPAHLHVNIHLWERVSALCKQSGSRGVPRNSLHRLLRSGHARVAARACQQPVPCTSLGQGAKGTNSWRSVVSGMGCSAPCMGSCWFHLKTRRC